MIIPDNVTVYMNGRAYYAHVCGFCQNGERLSLSIDTSGIIPTPPKPDFSSPRYCPDMACLNQILLDIDAYLIEKYGTTEKPNHDEYAAIEYFVNEYEKLERKHNGGSSHAPILKHSRREITINAQIGGKSVNITYDPHDPEMVKAAEVWRNALFADATQFKAVAPVAVKGGDNVNFREQLPGATLPRLPERSRRKALTE